MYQSRNIWVYQRSQGCSGVTADDGSYAGRLLFACNAEMRAGIGRYFAGAVSFAVAGHQVHTAPAMSAALIRVQTGYDRSPWRPFEHHRRSVTVVMHCAAKLLNE